MSSRLALILTLVLALAGCGGDGGGGSSSSGGDDPKAVVDDASKALAGVKSFHLEGTAVDKKDGEQEIAGDIALPGKVDLKLTTKEGAVQLRLVDGQLFFNADRAFWKAQGLPAQALQLVVDKWVKTPGGQDAGVKQFTALADPAKIGRCLIGDDTGTLSGPEDGDLDGEAVRIVTAKGDKPGTSPGRLYVAAEGDALPLRLEQTGPQKAGGTPDAECGDDGESDTQRSDIRLSAFDEPVDIEAPADAVDLEQLGNQAQS